MFVFWLQIGPRWFLHTPDDDGGSDDEARSAAVRVRLAGYGGMGSVEHGRTSAQQRGTVVAAFRRSVR